MTTETPTNDQRYMFDAAWLPEQRRLEALETIWDPFTFANLERAGVPVGGSFLEVGGGNGSIAAWLCERGGPCALVVATDLDTRFLRARRAANLEVREHDVTRDGLETGAYDLVHTRLLLSHLPDNEVALRRMAAALRPGGRLVVEEFDHAGFLPDPASTPAQHAVWDAWLRAFEALSAQRGLDLAYGRRLPRLLSDAGLADVHTEGHTVYERGGTPGRDLLRLSVQSLRDGLVATGKIDNPGVENLVEMLSDPAFHWQSQIMVAASAHKTAG